MMAGRRVVCRENEAFASFILAKREELAQKPKINENLDITFTNAFKNVCDHATPILNLRDAGNVRGIGAWMMKQLKDFFGDEPLLNNKGKKRPYLPQKNSAPYAILITLHRATRGGDKTFMMKQELIDAAELSGLSQKPIQPSKGSSASGRFGDSTKDWYSGWSSMKTLVSKGLIAKSSCPAKYMLTEEGRRVAEECMAKGGLVDGFAAGPAAAVVGNRTSIPAAASGGIRAADVTSPIIDIGDDTPQRAGKRPRKRKTPTKSPASASTSRTSRAPAPIPVTKAPDAVPSTIRAPAPAPFPTQAAAPASAPSEGGVRVWNPSLTASQGCNTGTFSNDLALPPLGVNERFSDVYEVVLVLDDRERFTRNTKGINSNPMFARRLSEQYQVEATIRHLPVGDAVWIARHRVLETEYVLDFIVERKGVDDLWTSIRDTRYKQQKLRLLRSGINRLIYLIEGDPNTVDAAESVKTAALTTEILEGFDVQRTSDVHDTISRYGELTNAISRRYSAEFGARDSSQRQRPAAMSYEEFRDRCNDLDKEKITDVFGVQLMQVKHVTEDIALSILRSYPTVMSLVQAYISLEGDTPGQENLLCGLPILNRNKVISSVVSKNVYKFIWAS